MADATTKLSGYLTTATAVTWTSGGLTSLADETTTSLSDAINNSSDKYAMADFELVLGSAPFTGTDSAVELYVIPSIDGTNYPAWAAGVSTTEQENAPHYVGLFFLTGATEAQRAVIEGVPLPNGYWKAGIRNRGNAAFASSGNTLSWRPHGFLADEA